MNRLHTMLVAIINFSLVLSLGFSVTQGQQLQDDDGESIQRPFYIIAHMANSVSTMDKFLAEGANGVEIDVAFEPNGAAWKVHHGVPCDYFRICHESTELVDYLREAASRNMTLIFLDLKCSKLSEEAKKFGGVDLARKLYEHFWKKGATQTNVLMSIPRVSDKVLLAAFIDEIQQLIPEQLKKISYEVSANPSFDAAADMFKELNITSAWQGDGLTNWLEPFRSYTRVKRALTLRDTDDSYIKKVYRWTVDYKVHIRQLIDMGVDGIMTNNPSRVLQLVEETKEIRLAQQKDGINDLFTL